MHRISRGVTDSRTVCAERRIHIHGNICILSDLHVFLFTYSHVCALRCPNGGGHGVHALLLPRVYLQTVTLMQCNDYFYSRYFGSPFTLSGMTPHWPTDYLCGCCHTWLLQLSPLSRPLHCQNLPSCITAPSSVSRSITENLYPSSKCYTFILFGIFLCFTTFIISSSPLSISHYHLYFSTFPNLAFLMAPCLNTWKHVQEGVCREVDKNDSM